jgi:multidrug efflux pump subunit AcrA (membrane-fusion protein)
MTARVSIHVAESKNTLVVPIAAVKSNNNGQYVVVVKQNVSQNVSVTTGITGDSKIEIVSGLSEGDEIVTSSAKTQTTNSTKGGMRVGGPGGM